MKVQQRLTAPAAEGPVSIIPRPSRSLSLHPGAHTFSQVAISSSVITGSGITRLKSANSQNMRKQTHTHTHSLPLLFRKQVQFLFHSKVYESADFTHLSKFECHHFYLESI